MRLLAGRLGDDLEARFQRVVALDQLQLGLAAAEQFGEQPLEVIVHGLERGQQALAGFLVEALDACAQLLDRFDEVVAFGGEAGVLGLDLAQFFLGAQVDGTEPVAVAAELFEIGFDGRDFRQLGFGRHFGHRGHAVRLDLEHVANFALDVFEAAAGCLHALLGAGGGFARGG